MTLLLVLILLILLFGGLGLWVAKWVLILALVCFLAAAVSGSRQYW